MKRNLVTSAGYYIGETALRIKKSLISPNNKIGKLKNDSEGIILSFNFTHIMKDKRHTFITATLCGSIINFIEISEEEYKILFQLETALEKVQDSDKILTPLLGLFF